MVERKKKKENMHEKRENNKGTKENERKRIKMR